ncbi:MAG TPA: serine/threonine-protein kinase [Gemmataceae bacterium]|nr:serine/threonine-protein kinase [Gemmataceae bacterium]
MPRYGNKRAGAGPAWPAIGDELFHFRLRRELGRGAFARVYLAEQADLAGRPVVLKVSPIQGNEPQTLAQLQHTNIVPIYSVHEDPERGLRAVCMPYFGGASLARVLHLLWAQTARPVRGVQLVEALERAQCSPDDPDEGAAHAAKDRPPHPILSPPGGEEDKSDHLSSHGGERDKNNPLFSHGGEEDKSDRLSSHGGERDRNDLIYTQGGERDKSDLLSSHGGEEDKNDRLSPVGGEGDKNNPLSPPGGRGVGVRGAPRVTGQTPLSLLRRLSYIRAVAWIVARLAEGLHHAHQRGVLHRDIKPSNTLLGADGQPMLLDFNLARNLNGDQAVNSAVLGGTVAYMAPEHLRALAARDVSLDRQVDHRSDIYSLGMVLYEMLTRESPFEQKGSYSALPALIELMVLERSRAVPSLRRCRSDIPWSLESIVRKCLAPDPAQRYQQAEHLAEDLRCFLEDRPLRHAPELSWVERFRKWTRRHPRLTSTGSVATVAAVLLVGLGAGAVGLSNHLAQTREQLQVIETQERKRAYEAGTLRALCLVNTTADLHEHAAAGRAACEETLALYGVLDHDDWQDRPEWQRLAPEDQQRLAEDTRELLLLLARARVRGAPGDEAVLREALALLDRAAAITGLAPSRAVWEDRAFYLEQLGESAEARAARAAARRLEPATARDHYLLATSYAREGRYVEAVEQLDQAIRLNPRHYWSLFQRGICYQELGRYALAASDFGVCIGLWPEFAWGHFNRAYALEQSGHKEQAIADYTAALERDPGLVAAYVNRGLACLELKRYQEALADFGQAARLGRDDAFLHAGRGVALEGLGRPAEADAAFAAAFARLAQVPEEMRGRIRWVYGFAVCARLPEKAREAFDEVLRRDPDQPQALYGRAMLLMHQGRDAEALPLLGRAAEASPGFLEARRCRALLLARAGRIDAARDEINWCLEREPENGSLLYAAACVSARAAEKAADPAMARLAAAQALIFLRKALERGYGHDRAAQDPDLAAIRSHPEFGAVLKEGRRPGEGRMGTAYPSSPAAELTNRRG